MLKQTITLAVLATVGLASASFADQVTTYRATEATSVTTSSATTASPDMAATTSSATMTTPDIATSTASVTGTESTQASAAEIMGTVQSVDRRNRSLIVQDNSGTDHTVSLTDGTHFYRSGAEVNYRDIEPNDVIQIRTDTSL